MKLQTLFAAAAFAIAAQATSMATPTNHQFTPKQLFEGIVLSHGPVASYLGQEDHAWSAKQTAAIGSIERSIIAKNPQFFNAFSAAVTSGDPGRVSKGLTDGANTIRRYVASLSGRNPQRGVILDIQDASINVNYTIAYVLDPGVVIQVDQSYMIVTPLDKRASFALEALTSKVAATLHK